MHNQLALDDLLTPFAPAPSKPAERISKLMAKPPAVPKVPTIPDSYGLTSHFIALLEHVRQRKEAKTSPEFAKGLRN